MGEIVTIEGLYKRYGDVRAVDGVGFGVEEGSLFAFLGLNGAGKSTVINILCTLLAKDAGTVAVAGFDLDRDAAAIRAEIGVVFQNSVLDPVLSVRDNLRVRAGYYGIFGAAWQRRLGELTAIFELGDLLTRPYGKLSGGQRRRADIARALIHAPRLLILDEPTTGLDPQTRRTVWNVVDRLRAETGMTVFLTTHYMEEANRAGDVVILDAGRIAARGSPVELKDAYSADYVRVYAPRGADWDARLAGYEFDYEQNRYRIRVADSAAARRLIAGLGDALPDFEVVKGDMDDVFLNVTGKRLAGGEQ